MSQDKASPSLIELQARQEDNRRSTAGKIPLYVDSPAVSSINSLLYIAGLGRLRSESKEFTIRTSRVNRPVRDGGRAIVSAVTHEKLYPRRSIDQNQTPAVYQSEHAWHLAQRSQHRLGQARLPENVTSGGIERLHTAAAHYPIASGVTASYQESEPVRYGW